MENLSAALSSMSMFLNNIKNLPLLCITIICRGKIMLTPQAETIRYFQKQNQKNIYARKDKNYVFEKNN
ncbi:MAG: hypothetical protein IJI37_03225, partial [Opitutales bacterium]|nr:hypothetical protein [Opitutales bacterium]